ncbi:MAG: 30S ribosomal protein S20 [Dehalococcoidia bacterium]|nr:30S ribosomal protein S20 [Dehalococcoidia bacterium]
MPSAKSNRASLRKRDRNLPMRSRAKTHIRSARRLIDDGDLDAADTAVKSAVVALDKAVAKGALHANNASRRKSRLMSQLSQARNG